MDRASSPGGYSGTPLPVKLGIKPGQAVAVLGGPAGFAERLSAQAGVEVRPDLDGGALFDVIIFFAPWRAAWRRSWVTCASTWLRLAGCGSPGRSAPHGYPRI